jgi:toxin ParE1/3/4
VNVIWTPQAEQDRIDIWDYIADHDSRAAVEMDALFSECAGRLKTQPMTGKSGKIPGTREIIPHKSYRLVYEIHGGDAWVLTVVHTARQWPPVR